MRTLAKIWSAVTCRRFPTARHVSPFQSAVMPAHFKGSVTLDPIMKLFEQKLTKATKMRNLRYAIYDLRDRSNARGIVNRISKITNFESPHVVSYKQLL
jgi:hypothetical protein